LFKGYGAKVGLGNMRVKAENRMVTEKTSASFLFLLFTSLTFLIEILF
jgi:hypothetical protein